jgi:hypothetical protein
MSLTKASYSMITGAPANVLDFGADPTGVVESTNAFIAAYAKSKSVTVPVGRYLVDDLRGLSGMQMIGEGLYNSILIQKNTNTPALNILSDPATYPALGQFLGIKIINIGVEGKTGATVSAVKIAAITGGAIFQSEFDFRTEGGFRGVEAICDGDGIFFCKFRLTVINTTDTSIVLTSGVYNEYSIFTSQNKSGVAVIEAVNNSVFSHLVSEGQLKLNGSKNVYNCPSVELIVGTALPAGSAAIQSTGNFQTLINPAVVLDAASAAKVTYAFAPFNGGLWENPTIAMTSGSLANPFATAFGFPWTLIGKGSNGATNKIEAIYLDSTADNAEDLRTVTFVGDCSGWTNYQTAIGGATIQYADGAPTSPTIQLRNTTTSMLLNYSTTIATVNINLPYFPSNGQIISFYCNSAISTINWNPVSGATINAFRGSASALDVFSIIYYESTDAWYRI